MIEALLGKAWSVLTAYPIHAVWIALLLIGCAWYIFVRQMVTGLPPGPLAIPIIGNAWLLNGNGKESVQTRLMRIGKKYNGIFTMYIGRYPVIWLSSYKTCHEGFVASGWDCAGRPPELPVPGLDPSGKGFLNMVHAGINPVECEVRDFVRHKLKGFGVQIMQNRIIDEINQMMKELEATEGTPFNPTKIIAQTIANITLGTLLGKRFDYDDAHSHRMIEMFSESVRLLMQMTLDDAFPILKLFPRTCRKEGYTKFRYCTEYLRDIVYKNVEVWNKGFPTNIMDVWMDQNAAVSGDKKETFDIDRLPMILGPLFVASYDTSTMTLSWIFAVMLHKPEVQKKVQDEIDSAIASGDITLEHQALLPYTESVMLEVMRMWPVAPFALPHYTDADVPVGGYTIPKGTRVYLHSFAVHYDETVWKDPYEFRPERFINNGKVHVPDWFVPFSKGRRMCMGDQIAKKQVFVIFANVMQKLTLLPATPEKLPSLDFHTIGFFMLPKPYEMKIKFRHRS
ncbi:cytochrome P450 2F2-like [Paramacrobiotus metropolitanus]|uniref:cytochrome P450 2F2-like n=1 Tax=Paramacrobiotus metropolitanus TaxID=2943436 RepID=UPI002445F1AD|nr:cytochrome P450 2F2-like [Paramacrobiotus metropolitanus]